MKYLIGFLVVVALVLAGFFVSRDSSDTEPAEEVAEKSEVVATGVQHSIVLTKEGYEPSEITISVGDEIEFSADSSYGNLHWPASNVHPSHDIYPEFDPLKPIEAGASWSFVFSQEGEWRFHDHLAPYHTGVVTVE